MASADAVALTFGRLRLEPDDGLWRGRTRIPLPPKETALLRLLAESNGRIVSKTEIFDRVWPGEDVGEASITRCMRGLRRALHEGGRRGGTIETVHGRGYRMALAVQSTAAPSEVAGVTSLRVGVGPFENASPQQQDEYLGPGIAGEVADCLIQTRANGITVIARRSALRLQRGAQDLLRIARALRIDYVVTGWLRRERGELRVQVEIVRVSDEGLVWSEEFRERRSRISRLPAAIATSVAAELGRRSRLSIAGRPVHASVHPKAYLALLQGHFASQLRTERGVRRGIELFERSIEWDPDHAEPYALLADAHLMLGFWGYEAPLAIAPRVGTFIQRALALDPRRVSALASLAYLRYSIDHDPAAAMRAVEQAATLEPGHARTEWARGQIHLIEGRFDAALAAFEASLDRDPFSPITSIAVPFTSFCAQQLDRALVEIRLITERDPEFAIGHALRATIAAACGRRDEVIRSAGIAESLGRGNAVTLGTCAWALAMAGCTAEAVEIRTALERKATRRYVGGSHLALAAVGLGDTEAAIAWLERGLAERCMFLPLLAVDARFAPLRGDPRFERIASVARGRAEPVGYVVTAEERPHPAVRSLARARAGARRRPHGRV